jgi:hypothetical protein
VRRLPNERTVLSKEEAEGGKCGKLEEDELRRKRIDEGESADCCDISEEDVCVSQLLLALPVEMERENGAVSVPCCGGVVVLMAIRPSPSTSTDDRATRAQLCSEMRVCTVLSTGQRVVGP